jgi:nucleoside-diphosphate-sugar epimerase
VYGFFLGILTLASKNQGIVIGDGSARTNPIHEADAARACVEALDFSAPAHIPVGGPIVYTRKQIVELAFECLGKPPAVRHVPRWVFPPITAMVRLVNRRIAGLYEFGTAVTQSDCLAPAYGTERLEDYFRKAAECPSPQPPSSFSASSN